MGHKHGPLSPEVREAVNEVDSAIEYLVTEAEALGKNINFIIVSDHGMEDLRKKETIYLTDKIKSEAIKFKFLGSGPMMQIYNMYNGDERTMIKHLKKQSRYFSTYSSALKKFGKKN